MSRTAWRLRRAAARLRDERIEIGRLLEAHGPGGEGAVLMLLAAPCLLPVPGVGSVLGLGIAAVAWRMWRGHDAHALPERVARQTMPRAWARRVLALLARVHAWAGRLARPRFGQVFASSGLRLWMPWLVAWLALLIVLPIPFGNVLPALALMMLGAGLVFLDGVLVAGALGAAGLATAFPALLVLAAMVWAPEAAGALGLGA